MATYTTHSQHISGQFNRELELIKNDLLEMGGKVERQIELATESLTERDGGLAEEVIEIDRDINQMEVDIDEQCARILARRQPAARDLRLIISIAKVTTDLERIGDEASKIARLSVKLMDHAAGNPAALRSSRVGAHVTAMLHRALDAFARLDANAAIGVVLSDSDIDDDYQGGILELQRAMRTDPDEIAAYMDRVWALRSLERIGDHASNIAEQVVYLARGIDVRHTDTDGLRQLLT